MHMVVPKTTRGYPMMIDCRYRACYINLTLLEEETVI